MVYLKLYIGATYSDTVQRRESARRRKFIQLVRKKLSHYEPALKVFHRQRDFYKGVLIVCTMSLTDSHC